MDDRPPNEYDVYPICFRWYPDNDDIVVSSDTGNKGLRDGILYRVLEKLCE